MTLTGIAESVLKGFGVDAGYAWILVMIVDAIIILFFLLALCLFLIYALRKVMGWIQVRIGPDRTGRYGWAQTPADALKLLLKEDVIPTAADKWVFTLAPIVVFVPALLVYVVIPFGRNMIARDLSIGIVYVGAVASIHVIGIIMAGWGSNNKYSVLGAFRAAGQLVTYEIPLVLAILGPVLLAGTLSMQGIIEGLTPWYRHFWILVPSFLIYFLCAMTEINLIPFDLSEAESELVAGYNIEYSGMKFAFFFLAEFVNSFTLAAVCVTLFFGGWHGPIPGYISSIGPVDLTHIGWLDTTWIWHLFWFMLKTMTVVFLLIWIRSTYPRVRIDQLINLGWKFLVPAGLVNIAFVSAVVVFR
jgi:NADH-quinone oxidoreductase subunit H